MTPDLAIGRRQQSVLAMRATARMATAAGSGVCGLGTARLARLRVPGAAGRRQHTGERVAQRLDRLGGAYLKAGQVLSTRADLLPQDVCSALARLCDDATAPAQGDGRWLAAALGSDVRDRLVELDPVALATGSVSQVYRARRADTGAPVVIKVLRPNVEAQFRADLMLIRAGARMVARLPLLRSVPVNDATMLMTAAVGAHLDLVAEADHHDRLAAQFKGVDGVVIPELHRDLCTPRALVMEYVEGRRIDDPGLQRQVAASAVRRALRCLYAMLFEHGLVHCDLHPGNVLIGAGGQLVLLDFGYVAQLTAVQQRAFAKLFVAMALNDADAITDVIIDAARSLPARLDRDALRSDLGEHVGRTSGLTAREFNVVRFVAGLFAIQHRHRIVAAPDFAMSILALMTLEGLIKHATPELDFQQEALPFVLRRLQAA